MGQVFSVTTTTHPEGDLKTGLSYARALAYATELVEGGFSPEISLFRAGEPVSVSWDELLHWEN